MHADGGGLYLQNKRGGRSWIFRYRDRTTGKRRELGLGSVRNVPLGEARRKAAQERLRLASNVDPLSVKKASQAAAKKAVTFGEYCDLYLETRLNGFKNEKHRYQWTATLTNDAAALRPLKLQAVTTSDVKAVLEKIWWTKQETASRLRQRIETVLDAAKAEGLRTGENPAAWRGNLKPFFGARSRKHRKHLAALPFVEMPDLMEELRDRESTSAQALEWNIRTVARTGETLGAIWDEIDFDSKIWTVPGERMKAGVVHRVPLTAAALAILKRIAPETADRKAGELIFKNRSGEGFSNAAMLECLRDLRSGVTVHGFRSTFRDWAGDATNFPRELAEAALAHRPEDEVEAAYRRGDALEKRRKLMEAWERYLAGGTGKIIQMKRRANQVENSAAMVN
jgi:integrase